MWSIWLAVCPSGSVVRCALAACTESTQKHWFWFSLREISGHFTGGSWSLWTRNPGMPFFAHDFCCHSKYHCRPLAGVTKNKLRSKSALEKSTHSWFPNSYFIRWCFKFPFPGFGEGIGKEGRGEWHHLGIWLETFLEQSGSCSVQPMKTNLLGAQAGCWISEIWAQGEPDDQLCDVVLFLHF